MKIVTYLCTLLLCSLLTFTAHAGAIGELQQRLNKVTHFHANFTQTVVDAEGARVQQGTGEVWVQRPDLFNWHMSAPDESVIVSDGKTVWFYNPFVEQVTATQLQDVTANTPFMLIARNQQRSWQQYNIIQQGDDFFLTPNSAAAQFQRFTVRVTADGRVQQFSSVAQDGQRTTWILQQQDSNPIAADKFRFTPPPGVTLDDQRR